MSTAEPLPRADRAVIPRAKVEEYLLNPEHEVGRHKARVFAAALGIRHEDWQYLSDQLASGVVGVATSSARETEWGTLYEVVIDVDGLNGQSRQVMTVWLAAAADASPVLVTAYVVDRPVGA